MRYITTISKMPLTALVCLLLMLFTGACARLPDYAKPHFNFEQNQGTIDPNAFGYRLLTKKDFQAISLPDDFIQYSHKINARSCLGIRSSNDTRLQISGTTYFGNRFYIGSIQKISFEAIFKPSCSWWNPEGPITREEYVLEHEQIHFALLELAAREINQTSEVDLASFIAFGKSVDDVKEQLLEKARMLVQKIMKVDLETQITFDEETSLYYDPKVQKKWYEDVTRRLNEDS